MIFLLKHVLPFFSLLVLLSYKLHISIVISTVKYLCSYHLNYVEESLLFSSWGFRLLSSVLSFSLNPLMILIKPILQEKNASVTWECLNFSSLRVIQVCLELVISLPQPLPCPASLSFLKVFCQMYNYWWTDLFPCSIFNMSSLYFVSMMVDACC